MNVRLITAILIAGSLFPLACSGTGERTGSSTRIGYISLTSLFDFAVTREPGALKLKKRKDELTASRNNIETRAREGDLDREKAGTRLREINNELAGMKAREEYYRKRILKRINTAVRRVAVRHSLDYILNIGDQVVYASRKYDLTEEVIQEMLRLEQRSDPVSR